MIWWILSVLWFVSIVLFASPITSRRDISSQADRVIRDHALELVGDFVGGTTTQLKPWWNAAEREAFGFNDTERFIAETDKILNPPAQIEHEVSIVQSWGSPDRKYLDGGYIAKGYDGTRGLDGIDIYAWGSPNKIRSITHNIGIDDTPWRVP